MYCKNCGNVLKPNDKFCNECGTKVEASKSSSMADSGFSPMFKREAEVSTFGSAEREASQTTAPKRNFHVEDFNWDLDGYPTEQTKKTEDIDFNWESVLDEREKRAKEEKPVEIEREGRPETVSRKEIAKPTIEQLEQQIFAEMGDKDELEDPQKTVRIDKFYTFNKKNEEFQALLDKEYERLKNNQEAIAEEESHTPTVDEILAGNAPEEAVAEAKTIEEPIAEEPEEEDAVDVQAEPELVAVALAETPEGIVSLGDEEEPVEEVAPEGQPVNVDEETPASEIENCPPSEEVTEAKDETAKEEAEDSDEEESEHKLTFDDVFADDDDDDYKEPKKKHTFLKIIAVILCILVVLEVAIICITNFAPESGAANWIVSTFDSIKNLFTGGGGAKG